MTARSGMLCRMTASAVKNGGEASFLRKKNNYGMFSTSEIIQVRSAPHPQGQPGFNNPRFTSGGRAGESENCPAESV